MAAKAPRRRIARGRPPADSRQYRLALEDTGTLAAQIDRGYALHASGRLKEAESVYREALDALGDDPLLHYNLGVLLEDLGRREDALAAYQAALRADPQLADCHHNLALLYKALGKQRDAIRHLSQYRRLTRRPK